MIRKQKNEEWHREDTAGSQLATLSSGVQLKNGAELTRGLSKHVPNAMVLTGLGIYLSSINQSINQQSMHNFFEL